MIFFTFIFLNMDISGTVCDIDLRFSVYFLKVPLEGSMSQIFDLGPSFHFMAKNG